MVQERVAAEENPDKLGKKTAEAEGVLAKIEKAIAQSDQRQSDRHDSLRRIAADREILLAAALSGRSPEAQAEADRLHAERVRLERDIRDEDALKARLLEQKSLAERRVRIARWREERAEVRLLLQSHLDKRPDARVAAATAEILAACEELREREEAAALALLRFDGSLRHEVISLRKLSAIRADLIAAKLYKILPPRMDGAYINRLRAMPSDYVERAIARAVELLDCLEPAS